MRQIISVIFCLLAFAVDANAQNDSFEQFKAKQRREFNSYKSERLSEFSEFRRKRNAEYADFLRKRWEGFKGSPAISRPKEKDVPPVIFEEELVLSPSPKPVPIPHDEVVRIDVPGIQPLPIKPIEELPDEDGMRLPAVRFDCFGTPCEVRVDKSGLFRLSRLSEGAISDAWLELSSDAYTNLVHDCLKLRDEHKLCDWGYLQLLSSMSSVVCGVNKTNESTLLMAYVYCQSGYQMRLGKSGGRLYMLYSSAHTIYGKPYFILDGSKYYVFGSDPDDLDICRATFPKESPLSLRISQGQAFSHRSSSPRLLQSARYPDFQVRVSCNKNLIDFYSTYPSSEIDNNFMTGWALYAETPFDRSVSEPLYSSMRGLLSGLSERESVERLLNWVQTAFAYGYDSELWGGERTFFVEETLFYPYADCEDRSILLTRLVRDLLGLKCILVYYPGHLAAAVNFREDVKGDYISLGSDRYVICDPTYINAGVGRTMPGMNNTEAKVIVLR